MTQFSSPLWRHRAVRWAVAGGALHALSLSPWCAALHQAAPAVVQTMALCLLLVALWRDVSLPRQAAAATWTYGTVWLIGATGWMYVSLHRFGEMPAWLALAAVVGLCAALSLYMAAVGWGWARWRRQVWWADALLFSGLWLTAEWARAVIFTGFPWGASGYGMLGVPLVKLAPWLGVYGLGCVWVLMVAASVWAILGGRSGKARVGVPLLLAGAVLGLSKVPLHSFTQSHGRVLSVSLLQGNVAQDEKFVSERQVPMLIWHARQIVSAKGQLVIAPETAIPLLPSQLPEGYWDQIKRSFGSGSQRYALIGVPLGDFDVGYTNSVAGLSADAMAMPEGMYRYNKHHLVPFGEVIPLGFHWFVQMMNMPLGDFTRGPLNAPPFIVQDQRIAPNICYEDLYGEEIAARFRDERQAPTILANVSNLAWFGEHVAIHQHLQIARMRSLEFQLPTLRATNTGATVVIDHDGRVIHALETNTRGVLEASVQGRTGITPFAYWASRWGLWPMFALAVLLIAAGCAGVRNRTLAPLGGDGLAIH
ncbi:apolipoprotein N-acyltransferase [Aquabacterium sp.]|uniref:apolipoprotein N-acyltransferase n=1 Tax=Aquabacterium sp. TaxID=1872578 RepID=UPI0025C19C76|nr:apolipoprotein N-acyltransferase [Aquabacterium sp.]